MFKPLHQSFEQTEKGHGRIDIRKLTLIPGNPLQRNFPGLKQIFKIERLRLNLGGQIQSTETCYGITSLRSHEASAERLLKINREHWHIENKVHYVRDVIFKEDHSRIRTGNGAHAMAILRNFAINILRLADVSNIGESIKLCSWQLQNTLKLFTDLKQ